MTDKEKKKVEIEIACIIFYSDYTDKFMILRYLYLYTTYNY